MKRLQIGLILFLFIPLLYADMNEDKARVEVARNRYSEVHKSCIEKAKKSGTPPLFFKECMADNVPQRCKALVWVENSDMILCFASCIGKNAVVGDCSN